MAIYAWLNGIWCKRNGFLNREPEVDHLLWHAADPPSDCGHSEDGGTAAIPASCGKAVPASFKWLPLDVFHPLGSFRALVQEAQDALHYGGRKLVAHLH